MLLLWPTSATGHASLIRSEPPANVMLDAAPKVIRLWYDEAVTPGLSIVSILDRSGLVVVQGGIVDARDPKVMELPVERLPPGIYTVSWKVLSAVDGHITRGAFAFIFLPPGVDPAKLVESGKGIVALPDWSRSLLAQGQVLAGWVHLVALFIGVGGLHFVLVILGVSRRGMGEYLPLRERLYEPAAGLATRAFAVALVTGILWWEAHTHLTTDTTLAHFLFRPVLLPYLLGARTSQSMGLRLGMLLIAVAFLHVARRRSPPSLALLGYCEALGAASLVGIALSSHSAAAWPSPLAVLFDTLHLWAGALWIGGLAVLAVVLPRSLGERKSEDWPPFLLRAMRQFTPWALGSVALLVLTGAFQVYLHIPRPPAMLQTTYGQALTLKLLLVLPMLFLGGVNSLIARSGDSGNSPTAGGLRGLLLNAAAQIQASGPGWLRSPQWAVRGEVALGLVILLCVAILTQLPPPKAASSAPPPTTLQAKTADLGVELTIASSQGLLAPSDLVLTIRQPDGRPIEGVTRVTIKPSMPGMEMSIAPIVASPVASGEHRAKTLLSMLGRWQFEVVVRRKGVEEDATFRFPYIVADLGTGQMEVGPALPERLSLRAAWSTSSTLSKFSWGVFLVVLGLAGGVLSWRWRRLSLSLVGLAVLLGGGYQVVNATVVDTTPTAWQANPIPADPTSLSRGRALYTANCVTCHGESGRGVGPRAFQQFFSSFQRADLTADHMEAHSDGDLFWWIGKGIRGTAMPGFEDSLGAEDRWLLVNYIRSLRKTAGGRS
jgi:copper transport protein